jgi:hypothetical protein
VPVFTCFLDAYPDKYSQGDAGSWKPEIKVPDRRGGLHPVYGDNAAAKQSPFAPSGRDEQIEKQSKSSKNQDVSQVHRCLINLPDICMWLSQAVGNGLLWVTRCFVFYGWI